MCPLIMLMILAQSCFCAGKGKGRGGGATKKAAEGMLLVMPFVYVCNLILLELILEACSASKQRIDVTM